MFRMVAIGPERFTLPLGAIGFEMAETRPDNFVEELRRLLADRAVALVVCGESFVTQAVMEEFKETTAAASATVLVVPDGPEKRGIGYEVVRTAIERAAGVDLLSSAEAEDTAETRSSTG